MIIISALLKKPVKLSPQEAATLRANATYRAELRKGQYDIRTRAQNGTDVTYHYNRNNGLYLSSYTVERYGR